MRIYTSVLQCCYLSFVASSSRNSAAAVSIGSALRTATETFSSRGILEPEASARYLLCDAAKIGYRESDLKRNIDRLLDETELSILESHISRRLSREPIQYILGNWDFYGKRFECRAPVLIPRPETEEMVERILSLESLRRIERPRILDIGTGSGVIAISLLSELGSRAECVAIDPNPAAIELTQRNAESILGHGFRDTLTCLQLDLSEFMAKFCQESKGTVEDDFRKFDIIVSNPPYIPSTEMAELQEEVRAFEDWGALDGGHDGLNVVKQILAYSPGLLRRHGTRQVWMEVSEGHPDLIVRSLKKSDQASASIDDSDVVHFCDDIRIFSELYNEVEDIKDLFGNPRFVRLTAKLT